MMDTDDLALWYALNRLMTNYWADGITTAVARRTSFIYRRRSTPSATTGSKDRRKFALFMPGAGSAAIPPRDTWSTIFRYSGRTRGTPRRSG